MLWWNLRQLSSPDPERRGRAAQRLGLSRNTRAVPRLAQALDDIDLWVSRMAAKALGQIGGTAALDVLLSAFRSKPRIENEAKEALDSMDPNWRTSAAAKRIVPALLIALGDKSKEVRRSAARVLEEIADIRALEALVKSVRDQDPTVRGAAVHALFRIDPKWYETDAGKRTIAALVADLNSYATLDRRAAIWMLSQIGDTQAIGPIGAALADGDPSVQEEALSALGRIDPKWSESAAARSTVPQLVRAISHSHWAVRKGAHKALARIDQNWARSESALGVVPALVSLVARSDVDAIQDAAGCLAEIGDSRAIPALVGRLLHSEPAAQEAVATALDRIDPRWRTSDVARQAVPPIVEALDSEYPKVRASAARALGEIGVSSFIAAYAGRDPAALEAAAAALARCDPNWRESEAARTDASPILAALNDLDLRTRTAMTRALMLMHWEPGNDLEREALARESEKVTLMSKRGLI